MKVIKMEGALLDFWVAKAAGERPLISPVDGKCRIGWKTERVPCESKPGTVFAPSTDWSQGGPLFSAEGIDCDVNLYKSMSDKTPMRWIARKEIPIDDGENFKSFYAMGPTELIAKARAFVSSKFGDDVPDEVA